MNLSLLLSKCFGTSKSSFDHFDHSEHGFDFLETAKSLNKATNQGQIKSKSQEDQSR